MNVSCAKSALGLFKRSVRIRNVAVILALMILMVPLVSLAAEPGTAEKTVESLQKNEANIRMLAPSIEDAIDTMLKKKGLDGKLTDFTVELAESTKRYDRCTWSCSIICRGTPPAPPVCSIECRCIPTALQKK